MSLAAEYQKARRQAQILLAKKALRDMGKPVPGEIVESAGRDRCIRLAEEGDPFKALAELGGYLRWPSDAKRFITALLTEPQVIGLGGHNTSKTFGLSALNLLWFWQCIGNLPDQSGRPQGCIIYIIGPGEKAVLNAAYRRGYLDHAETVRAHTSKSPEVWGPKGLTIEGFDNASEASVNWVADATRWFFIGYYPRAKAGDEPDLLHQMSGVHHPTNGRVHLEEAAALHEMAFATARGFDAKTVACVLNPVSPSGPVYQRSSQADWTAVEMSQLRHQNVLYRDPLWIPGGPSHKSLERDLRDPIQVTCIGLASEVPLDASRGQFLYALPSRDLPDKPGPREDAVPGHPDAETKVFEPTRIFSGQRLGRYLLTAGSGVVFPPVCWDNCVSQRGPERTGIPDVVGVDCAEKSDRNTAMAWFGLSARAALERLDEAKASGMEHAAALREAVLCFDCRGQNPGCRSCGGRGVYRPQAGAVKFLPTDVSADDKALALINLFPVERRGLDVLRPVYQIDASGGGYELQRALHHRRVRNVVLINFGSSPPPPRPGVTPPLNMRAAMYQDLSHVVLHELVELPDQDSLKEECAKVRSEEVDAASGKAGRMHRLKIGDKKLLKRALGGKSPDMADALALASCGAASREVVDLGNVEGLEEWG